MKFLKALAITAVVSLYGVINSTYAQAMTFEELYEIKTERLNAQSFGSPFALDPSDGQINAFLNLALINSYLSEDEHGGVFIDGDTLVVVELIDPNSNARTRSMERIHEFANSETRILSNFLRIEQGRFSHAELISVINYISYNLIVDLIDELEPIVGGRIPIILHGGPIIQENIVEIGLSPIVYNDEELRNEVIGHIKETVSNLSPKEDFSNILSFVEGWEIEFLGLIPQYEYESYQYDGMPELEEDLVVDNFNTLNIQPGRTQVRPAGSGSGFTANNLLNGRLITAGHGFRMWDQVFVGNTMIGSVHRHSVSGSVDGSGIGIYLPSTVVRNTWPDGSTITGNSGMFNVSGGHVTAFGSTQSGSGGRTGEIIRTNFVMLLEFQGQVHRITDTIVTTVTGVNPGDSGGPIRTSQGFNSGIVAGRVLAAPYLNRMVYVCIQRAMNVL